MTITVIPGTFLNSKHHENADYSLCPSHLTMETPANCQNLLEISLLFSEKLKHIHSLSLSHTDPSHAHPYTSGCPGSSVRVSCFVRGDAFRVTLSLPPVMGGVNSRSEPISSPSETQQQITSSGTFPAHQPRLGPNRSDRTVQFIAITPCTTTTARNSQWLRATQAGTAPHVHACRSEG